MILLPRSLCGRTLQVDIRLIQPSDHTGCPRLSILPITTVPKTRPMWRMNTTHLGSPYVLRRLNQFLEESKSLKLPAYDRLLSFKRRTRKFLTQYGIDQAARKSAAELRLLRNRENALQLLNIAPGSIVAAQLLFMANNAIGSLLQDNDVARLERRSHAWLRDGDCCTMQFFQP